MSDFRVHHQDYSNAGSIPATSTNFKKRNMANMSYCRFENTTNDMEDCIYAIENGETDELSSYEVNALEDFVQIAKNIINSNLLSLTSLVSDRR